MTETAPGTARVLLVDDEEVLRQAISWDLKRKGHQVFEAENGQKALDVLARQPIDVVLTDVRMPVCDGIELLSRIRAERRDGPVVIFLTGFADLTPEFAYDLGADGVFPKPFDRRALLDSVTQSLIPLADRWKNGSTPAAATRLELHCSDALPGRCGSTVHFGRGGFFARFDGAPLPQVQDVIRFQVSCAQGNIALLEGHGVVRWVRPSATQDEHGEWPRGFGLEITSLPAESLAAMRALLAKNASNSWIPKS